MMKIEDIWKEMEADYSVTSGMLIRRAGIHVRPDIYIGMRRPEKTRCLLTPLPGSMEDDIPAQNNLQAIRIEKTADPTGRREDSMLLISLSQVQDNDIFSLLCEDLITSVAHLDNGPRMVQTLLQRLERWKSLFRKSSGPALTESEQQGLYGELYFLRRLIQEEKEPFAALCAWTGADKADQDFISMPWSAEIKTSQPSSAGKIHISGENQLSRQPGQLLYLWHLILQTDMHTGETLNEIIHSLYTLFTEDDRCRLLFRTKLYAYGYAENHTPLYDNTTYQPVANHCYEVRDGFPCLDNSIAEGVCEVKYSITTSYCTAFLCTEDEIIQHIPFQ